MDLVFFIGMVLFLVLSVIRIKVTTRVQLIVGIATVAVIILIDLITTAKGGSNGQALGAFSFSHTNSGGFNGVAPKAWQRFLDIQLAGMRAAGPLSSQPPMSSRQLSKLATA